MKKLLLCVSFFLLIINLYPSDYKKIKVYVNDTDAISSMAQKGIAVDEVLYNRREGTVTLFVNEYEMNIIKSLGLAYEILIDNWKDYYKKHSKITSLEKQNFLSKNKEKYGVSGFGYGTMGGFLKLDEIYKELDTMRMLYPNLITKQDTIGYTFEDRALVTVKISDNPEQDENEPEVLYTALTHAREPQGMMTVIYFMYYLLENYDNDPVVKYLVDNRELYFIPVVNPDGYFYNQTTDPDGGGMWRKNRKLNSDKSYGVDLNRNFGPYEFWNAPNNGSSANTGSDTYRGTMPFSEYETGYIREFLAGREIKVCLNYHTYSNLLVYPFGALQRETSDSLIFREFAHDMTAENNYMYGTDMETVRYSTRGGADDFMYGGDTLYRGRIISMTPEVGGLNDGFWPLQERIFPLVQENLAANLFAAHAAGSYPRLTNHETNPSYFNPGDSVSLNLAIKNKGLVNTDNIKIKLVSLDNYSSVSDEYVSLTPIPARSSLDFEYPYKISISNSAKNNEKIKLLLNFYSDNYLISSDTIKLNAGLPVVLFSDSGSNETGSWAFEGTAEWEKTTDTYHSYPSCYTDSKKGFYNNSSLLIMTTGETIDLTGTINPVLTFWTKYNIEKIWDYGIVKVSEDDGSSWDVLRGKYPRLREELGQIIGDYVYDGSQVDWVKEEIDLSSYAGSKIKIGFELRTDDALTKDGWYIDDIKVLSYTTVPVEVAEQTKVFKYKLEQNYPNPFNPGTVIGYTIGTSQLAASLNPSQGGTLIPVTLKVYDILGKEVAVLVNEAKAPGNYNIMFDAGKYNLSSGIYFYRIKAGKFTSTKKLILIK